MVFPSSISPSVIRPSKTRQLHSTESVLKNRRYAAMTLTDEDRNQLHQLYLGLVQIRLLSSEPMTEDTRQRIYRLADNLHNVPFELGLTLKQPSV